LNADGTPPAGSEDARALSAAAAAAAMEVPPLSPPPPPPPLEHRPLSWCVQVTDLHLSHRKAHAARAKDLLQLLEFVQTASGGAAPCFVVSGDLTDSKTGWFASGQHWQEWAMYRAFVSAVERAGGMLLDLPGYENSRIVRLPHALVSHITCERSSLNEAVCVCV